MPGLRRSRGFSPPTAWDGMARRKTTYGKLSQESRRMTSRATRGSHFLRLDCCLKLEQSDPDDEDFSIHKAADSSTNGQFENRTRPKTRFAGRLPRHCRGGTNPNPRHSRGGGNPAFRREPASFVLQPPSNSLLDSRLRGNDIIANARPDLWVRTTKKAARDVSGGPC